MVAGQLCFLVVPAITPQLSFLIEHIVHLLIPNFIDSVRVAQAWGIPVDPVLEVSYDLVQNLFEDVAR